MSDSVQSFDPSKVKKLSAKEILKRVGPGLILTGIVIGPGNITTSAMLGGNYGYSMIWIWIPIIFMGVTFVLTAYRISMLSGMPLIHAIRKYYGKVAAGIVGCATFLSCLFFTLGNITGCGTGMNLIFGLNWKIGAIIIFAVLAFCYFTKGVYSKVEKFITFCILAMIAAFLITLVGVGGPDIAKMGRGLTHWGFAAGSFATALGYISTNASVTSGIYGTYLGVEKKWKKEDLFNGALLADAIVHVASVLLISGMIVLVGAIVLHPTGQKISSPQQLAEMLKPIMGASAKYVMGIALLGAGFSSILANTQRGMVLLAAGFDKPTGLEEKFIKWGCVVCIVFAAAICFSYGKSPVQLIYIANVATSVATPFGGLFMCLLIGRKEVNGGLKPSRPLQICMIIAYIFACVMTAVALRSQIPNLIRSFANLAK